MTGRYDATIIGTGQSGPSLATRMNREGIKVALVERELLPGDASSGRRFEGPDGRGGGPRVASRATRPPSNSREEWDNLVLEEEEFNGQEHRFRSGYLDRTHMANCLRHGCRRELHDQPTRHHLATNEPA